MIDPLEAGPDPEEPVEEDAVDEATAEGGVVEDDAPSVAMAALEAATKEVAEEQKKEMEMEVQKKERKKMEKSTHGGCEGPIVWSEFSELEDGCRAHLVSVFGAAVQYNGRMLWAGGGIPVHSSSCVAQALRCFCLWIVAVVPQSARGLLSFHGGVTLALACVRPLSPVVELKVA